MPLTITGYGDDHIAIEGDLTEWLPVSSETANYLAFSDGTVLCADYPEENVWRLTRVVAGSSSFSCAEWVDDEGDRTDRAMLGGEIRWVVCGQDFFGEESR